jgi:hypothetical protein
MINLNRSSYHGNIVCLIFKGCSITCLCWLACISGDCRWVLRTFSTEYENSLSTQTPTREVNRYTEAEKRRETAEELAWKRAGASIVQFPKLPSSADRLVCRAGERAEGKGEGRQWHISD